MALRLALTCVLALVVAGSASADTAQRKESVDARIAQLREKIADANRKEDILTSEISAVTSEIRGLQGDVDAASAQVAQLESELAVYKNRLAILTQLFQAQTERLQLLRAQNALAERRLQLRLIALYETDEVSTVALVLSSGNLSDLIDGIDLVNQVTRQDRSIVGQVKRAKNEMRVARAQTEKTRAGVAQATAAVEIRTNEQRAVRDRLLASQRSLADARSLKRQTLSTVRTGEQAALEQVAGLEQVSAALAARIRAAQAVSTPTSVYSGGVSSSASSTGGVSAAGFIWPVSGSVASPFGYRCLAGLCRMHEGIDIGAGYGTPIHAAASGTVIFVGWMDGYGNLVVIDHGNGLSTAYAHQSTIAAAMGQSVVQGQVIGYVGCTGRCFGPHLHFEVRVNGSAVDPLGYL
jgi:murein DD-endopeptidase MepM/ murein hydrolase activator NlpD